MPAEYAQDWVSMSGNKIPRITVFQRCNLDPSILNTCFQASQKVKLTAWGWSKDEANCSRSRPADRISAYPRTYQTWLNDTSAASAADRDKPYTYYQVSYCTASESLQQVPVVVMATIWWWGWLCKGWWTGLAVVHHWWWVVRHHWAASVSTGWWVVPHHWPAPPELGPESCPTQTDRHTVQFDDVNLVYVQYLTRHYMSLTSIQIHLLTTVPWQDHHGLWWPLIRLF